MQYDIIIRYITPSGEIVAVEEGKMTLEELSSTIRDNTLPEWDANGAVRANIEVNLVPNVRTPLRLVTE
jgi:hypothetical protein